MARRKNVKRIDPRYFLHETVNRNDDGSRLEEALPPEPDWRKGFDPKQVAAAKKAAADKEAPETAAPEDSRSGLANVNMYQHDPERDAAERSYNTSQLARARARAGMEEGSSLEEAEFQDTGFGEEDIEVNRAAALSGFEEMQAQQKILDAVVAAAVEAVGDWIDDEDSDWPQPGSTDREAFIKELDTYSQTYAGISVADVLGN